MGKVSEYALKSIEEAVEAAKFEGAEYVSPYITTEDAEAILALVRRSMVSI